MAHEHEMTPEQVLEAIEAGEAQVVDVRETYEREAGHVAGTRHIAMEQLASEAMTLDRERPVIFYCRVGARSAMATEAFRAAGFTAFNMTGGLVEWVRRGLPLEPEDGHVAEH